ncbi:MAG: sugar ABC transporter permease [Oscillospiraceae bacterium]|nr:sugar ABC transporter permease [Oscillospiraceae bacterium]
MKRLNDLEYLKLNRLQAFLYKLKLFFCAIPGFFKGIGLAILNFFKNCGLAIKNEFKDIFTTFTKGNWAVKLSFFIFGFGNLYYGQIMRGLLFLLFEVVFIGYMLLPSGGIYWLSKGNWFQTGATVGTVQGGFQYDPIFDVDYWVGGDDSVKVLLYGLLTIIFIIAFIYTWRLQVKQCRICMDITAKGKRVRSGKDDLKSLLDDQFHKTLLALPITGILVFTVLPIIYMVLIAFTSYDAAHDGYANLFSWVGLENFNEMFNFGKGGLGLAFGEILSWTLMWAFFATFTNYFLGMFVAIMINKKGIKIKKFWRTVLVMTIAVPQFVSLLYVSKLFDSSGIIGKLLINWNLLPQSMVDANQMSLWQNPLTARILVIVINIWVGIPHIMLMATGILMNIPQDLYESSRIDGANTIQQYTKITLPYMMFVMGPYLLTSFVNNLNNFNVIYLLTNNSPLLNTQIGSAGGVSVSHTDLLITWLYKMTLNSAETKYYLASIIGILVFVVVAVLSLIVYNVIPSTKNEEDYR